eukprot:99655_1
MRLLSISLEHYPRALRKLMNPLSVPGECNKAVDSLSDKYSYHSITQQTLWTKPLHGHFPQARAFSFNSDNKWQVSTHKTPKRKHTKKLLVLKGSRFGPLQGYGLWRPLHPGLIIRRRAEEAEHWWGPHLTPEFAICGWRPSSSTRRVCARAWFTAARTSPTSSATWSAASTWWWPRQRVWWTSSSGTDSSPRTFARIKENAVKGTSSGYPRGKSPPYTETFERDLLFVFSNAKKMKTPHNALAGRHIDRP